MMQLIMGALSKGLTVTVLARKLSTSAARSGAIKNVVVIGGGLMGSGIAQV